MLAYGQMIRVDTETQRTSNLRAVSIAQLELQQNVKTLARSLRYSTCTLARMTAWNRRVSSGGPRLALLPMESFYLQCEMRENSHHFRRHTCRRHSYTVARMVD